MRPDFHKQELIPVIVQDYQTNQVLMLAYTNEVAFEKMLETGETWFWSRSRQKLWHKGEESGHFQKIKGMRLDCDQDTLLVFVEQIGNACHTGAYSCFYDELIPFDDSDIFSELEKQIIDRKLHPVEKSYTNYLLGEGIDKVLKKVGEEATEVVIGAKNADKEEIANETADVLYHLAVMLVETGVSPEDVEAVLKARQGKQSNVHDRKEVTDY